MSTFATTRFLFVRSGETAWNRSPRSRGHADVPLNETGREQARLVGLRLAREPVSAVYASPLSRAMETAWTIARHHHLEPLPSDALLDMDHGDWEGRTPEEAEAGDTASYAYWLMQPARASIPGAEPVTNVRSRVVPFVEQVAARRPGTTVVLVSHDIVGRALMTAVLGLPLDAIRRITHDNAALSAFERRSDRFVIQALNDTGHLGPQRGESDDISHHAAARRDRAVPGAALSMTT